VIHIRDVSEITQLREVDYQPILIQRIYGEPIGISVVCAAAARRGCTDEAPGLASFRDVCDPIWVRNGGEGRRGGQSRLSAISMPFSRRAADLPTSSSAIRASGTRSIYP